MEDWMDYLHGELLILVPVLYLIGVGFKRTSILPNRWIPVAIGGLGIVLSLLYTAATSELSGVQSVMTMMFTAVTQGILLSGTSVFCNQIYKQLTEKNDSKS
jgi:hypothetical protein